MNRGPTETSLLDEMRQGDPGALGRLFAVVYDKLHEIARTQGRRRPGSETLTTTALVHEAFIKLFGSETRDFSDRAHFMAVAATAMREILIGHARRNAAAKRGGGQAPASFEEVERALASESGFVTPKADALLALDRAVERLHQHSERQSHIVECRFFGGMSVEETATALGISPATVKRDWSMVQAWLHRELQRDLGMRGEDRATAIEWSELEALWELVHELPADQRDALLAPRRVDGALRQELDSLLDRASVAEAFFDRFLSVVPEAGHAAAIDGMDAGAPVDALPPPDRDPLLGSTLGHYHIVERLGQGGMGVVYRALDLRLHRTVALKLLRAHTPHDPRAKERLLVEARAAAALDHPNICTIYEVGETPEMSAFIAMAFYPGRTLEQALEPGPLPVATALDYATQIARGLGAAHERGIIHRDVKPANIIVTADGVAKLLDFGIARLPDVDVSREGVTPGTIAYMSPEQVTSRALDRRTDLWSLGVLLHEMVSGERPFRGESAGAVLYAILQESPPPVSTVRDELSGHLDSVIARLLAKDRDLRYGKAEELIADLTEIREGRAPAKGLTHGSPASEAPARDSERDDDDSIMPQEPVPATPRRRWGRRTWYGAAAVALGAGIVSWPLVLDVARGGEQRSARPPDAVLSPQRMAAMDLLAQARRDVLFRTDSGRRLARDLFKAAITADSTYAAAHAGLALMGITPGDHNQQTLATAEESARTAIRLDSLLPEAHAALGRVLVYNFRFAEAEAHLIRAIELDGPQSQLREFLIALYVFMGRPRDVLEQAEQFERNNPGASNAIAELARGLLVTGRCDEALAQLDRLAHLRPPPARAGNIAAQCHALRKQWPQAIASMRRVAATNERALPYLGYMLARGRQSDSARTIRDTLLARRQRGEETAYGLAVVYAGFGDFDSAFQWLDQAYDDRSLRPDIMEPVFEDLRRDARFDKLREKLGIQKR